MNYKKKRNFFSKSLFFLVLIFLIFSISFGFFNVLAKLGLSSFKFTGFEVLDNFTGGESVGFEKMEVVKNNFEKEVGSLEIKEPVVFENKVLHENKNERMDFEVGGGHLRLYFDLMNYSNFVNLAKEEIAKKEKGDRTEGMRGKEGKNLGITGNVVEGNITEENISIMLNESTQELEIPSATEPEVAPSSDAGDEGPVGVGDETLVNEIEELKIEEIREKIEVLEDEIIENITEDAVVDVEDFDIVVDERESIAEDEYKWGYKMKIDSMDFFAKVDVTSDLGLSKVNEYTLKVGDNYLLDFSDLIAEGYSIRLDVPSLEMEVDNKTQIRENKTEEVENITEIIINETVVNETEIAQELEIPNATESEIVSSNDTGIEDYVGNETLVNETEEIDNKTQIIDANESGISNTTEPKVVPPSDVDNETIIEEKVTEPEQIVNETIPEEVTEVINDSVIEEEIVEEKVVDEGEVIDEGEEVSEEVIEETEEEAKEEAEEVIVEEESEEVAEAPTEDVGITGNVIGNFFRATGKAINEFISDEPIEISDVVYDNKLTIYIERDFRGTDYEVGDEIFLDPSLIVIKITKARHLDENRSFVEDVYDKVKERDDNWTLIPENHSLRVKFEKNLTREKDITIYARAKNQTSIIEVFRKDDNRTVAIFENISNNSKYQIFLTNLSENESLDVFDLKVAQGDISFDYVVDPVWNLELDSTVEINDYTANGPILNNEDYYGSSVSSLGDLNGDSVNDLAVGAEADDGSGNWRGAVHIHFMNSDGSVKSTVEINDNTVNGPTLSDGDTYGTSVANLGDLNSDGIDDLVVGARGDDTGGNLRGVVHIHFMNSDGSVKSTVEINDNTANGPTLSNGDSYGSSVSSIGDLNNDGVVDLVIGANGDETVHIHFMNSDGSVKSTVEINDNTVNGPILSSGDYYGSSVSSIGDLNGDGVEDLVVGAVGDDTGGNFRGVVHIHFMNSDGSVKSTVEINDNTANGPTLSDSDRYGSSVSGIGDLNGDGVVDLVVGANSDDTGGSSRGAIHVHFMNSDGSVKSTVEINDYTTNGPVLSDGDTYGISVSGIGDLNGDGVVDLVVGANWDDARGSNRGAVHIHFMGVGCGSDSECPRGQYCSNYDCVTCTASQCATHANCRDGTAGCCDSHSDCSASGDDFCQYYNAGDENAKTNPSDDGDTQSGYVQLGTRYSCAPAKYLNRGTEAVSHGLGSLNTFYSRTQSYSSDENWWQFQGDGMVTAETSITTANTDLCFVYNYDPCSLSATSDVVYRNPQGTRGDLGDIKQGLSIASGCSTNWIWIDLGSHIGSSNGIFQLAYFAGNSDYTREWQFGWKKRAVGAFSDSSNYYWCCDSSTDCVFNAPAQGNRISGDPDSTSSGCYNNGATVNTGGGNGADLEYCSSGTWLTADSSSTACNAIAGASHWAIGGETASTTCCGDDASENRILSSYHTSIENIPAESDACCDNVNDCVHSNGCTSNTGVGDIDGDGDLDYCSSGNWTDCNDDSQCQIWQYCSLNDCVNISIPAISSVIVQTDNPLNSEQGGLSVSWSGSLLPGYEYRLEQALPSSSLLYEGSSTNYLNNSLNDNSEYCYRARVQSADESHYSDWSEVVCNITGDRSGPNNPEVVLNSNSSGNKIDLDISEGDDGLVLYLPFEEGSGTSTEDWSSEGNDGAITGANWVDGKSGGALEFDYGSDSVTISHDSSLEPSSLTVSFWTKLNSDSERDVIVTKWLGYTTEVNADGTFRWGLNGLNNQYFGTKKISFGEWHFLSGTYDFITGVQCNYIDGVKTECQTPGGSLSYSQGELKVGYHNMVNGQVDEVRIYNRALTQEEIIDDMQSGLIKKEIFRSDEINENYKNLANLVKNGDAETGDITNFNFDTVSSSSYSGDYAFSETGYKTVLSTDFIPVDLDSEYSIKGMFKSIGSGGGSRLYFGYSNYDTNKIRIRHENVHNVLNTETTLYSDIVSTDKIVKINDCSNWYSIWHAYMAFEIDDSGNYLDLPNRELSNYNITRVTDVGDYCEIEFGSTVGKTYPAGTKVRMHISGGNYMYVAASNAVVPNVWTEYKYDSISGENVYGAGYEHFWPGTRYVKVLGLLNYAQDSTYTILVDNISITADGGKISSNTYEDNDATDNTKPEPVTALQSSSHQFSRWSNDTTIDISWNDGSDNGNEYFYYLKAFDEEGNVGNMLKADSIQEHSYSGTGYSYWSDYDIVEMGSLNVGDIFVLEGEVKVDAVRQSAGGESRAYIWTGNSTDSWQRSISFGTSSTEWVPFTKALSVNYDYEGEIKVGVYHFPSDINDGTSYVRNLQVHRVKSQTITSNLDGHATSFTEGQINISSPSKDVEDGIQLKTSSSLSDSNNWYFNILSVDNANNWRLSSETQSIGPFWICTNSSGVVDSDGDDLEGQVNLTDPDNTCGCSASDILNFRSCDIDLDGVSDGVCFIGGECIETETFFNSQWNTSAVSDGSSNSTSISLPLESGGTYDFVVNWGDGNSGTVTSWDDVDKSHTYASEGVYNVSISGTIEGFRFNNGGDRLKIIDISQWGNLRLINLYESSYFYGCANLDSSATDVLNLSGITNLQSMFRDCSSFNGDISGWDVSEVTSISNMFSSASFFNGNISNWDLSSVTDMRGIFNNAINFNSDISNWDVSSVTDMRYTFLGASSFNGDISDWDVSSVTSMGYMFDGASSFNGNISGWDVSNVTNMDSMFSSASSFNHDLNNWNVSSVTYMGRMFLDASSFNHDLNNWNVSSVTDMNNMFLGASSFNHDLSNWDVSSVTDMNNMFHNAINFSGDLSDWNVSSVVNMERMFYNVDFFNGNLSNWDVSSVDNMRQMFAYMENFNQDLGPWDVSNVTDMSGMFYEVTLSISNYDSLLNGWASLPSLQNSVNFHAGNSQYCLGESARDDTLIGTYGWSITDGGRNCSDYVSGCQELNESDKIYILQNNITTNGTCFDIKANNVTLDLNGYNITGDKGYLDKGVYVDSFDKATIKNGGIYNFGEGIRLYNSEYNNVNNIVGDNNYYAGFWLMGNAKNNIFKNIISNNNDYAGIYLESSTNNSFEDAISKGNGRLDIWIDNCDNYFENVTVSRNIPLAYYNNSINLESGNFSELILCNANNSNISNINISGDTEKKNNGLVIIDSYDGNFSNINTSFNYEGIKILRGANNILKNIKINDNVYGIRLSYASSNILSNIFSKDVTYDVDIWHGANNIFNKMSLLGVNRGLDLSYTSNNIFNDIIIDDNSYGVYFSSSSNNTLNNITATNNNYGIYITQDSENNTFKNSHVENNTNTGLFFYSSFSNPMNNSIYNNYFSNNLNYDYTTNFTNYFNTTLIDAENIIGGSKMGGNFWKHPNNTGFSLNCEDLNRDGICDNVYNLGDGNFDYLALRVSNSFPTTTLISPLNNNLSTNRTLAFSWEGSDIDGDDLIYQLNISCYNNQGGGCADDNRLINVNSNESYVLNDYLRYLSDNGYYYNWTVRASDDDGTTYGEWATPRRLEIQSEVILYFLNDIVYFGSLQIGQTDDTTDDNPQPFLIENDGNCMVNVTMNATSLWTSVPENTDSFKYKIDNSTEIGSFDWLKSLTSWVNVSSITGMIVSNLNWSDESDSFEMDLAVEVPVDEPAGNKDSTFYFLAKLNE